MAFIIDQYSLSSALPYTQPPPPTPFIPTLPQPPFGGPWPWPWPWHIIHVIYTEARLPAGVDPDPANPVPAPTLRYQDGTQTLTFSGNQITSQATAIGRLLTVTPVPSVDQGDTLFTLILPGVTEPAEGAEGAFTAISALGITIRTTENDPAQTTTNDAVFGDEPARYALNQYLAPRSEVSLDSKVWKRIPRAI